MVDLIKFIFSKKFFIHIVLAVAVTTGGLWYLFQYLDDFTLHGETITVPDFKGVTLAELDTFSKQHQLRYEVLDSVYLLTVPKGTVVEQNPGPESQVKDGRKIYLTVNAMRPPMVKLPNVKSLSLRHATAIIESYNLKLGKVKYKPAPCTNCVLFMEIDNEQVEPGKSVVKDTEVILVLGQEGSGEQIPLPCLLNFSEEQARNYLNTLGLNLGAFPYSDCESEEDSLEAKIYSQTPECDTLSGIQLGGTIDVFLTCDSTKWVLPQDSLNISPKDSL